MTVHFYPLEKEKLRVTWFCAQDTRVLSKKFQCRIWGPHNSFYKNNNFCDLSRCDVLKINRRFGGTYRCRRACHLHSRWYLSRFILRPWRWRWHLSLKRPLTFNGLHGIISQKMVLYKKWNTHDILPTPSVDICFNHEEQEENAIRLWTQRLSQGHYYCYKSTKAPKFISKQDVA
jgi:hypothetical protein